MQFDIRRFDVYRKVPKDLTQPTLTGAVISICCVFFMILLLLSEFADFITKEIASELFVDDPISESEIVPVHLNITLTDMECDYLGLDIQDDLGRHEVGHVDDTRKYPLPGQGCRFETEFRIKKVPGNFHVSTHSARSLPANPNMKHIIHNLYIGNNVHHLGLPGSFSPLTDVDKTGANGEESHDYFMKIVPTIYEDLGGKKVFPFQYTYAYRTYIQHTHGGRGSPAIWFRYDLSPITVKYHERRKPIYTFITALCAIIGGTFTVAGIIDSTIFTASEMWKKFEIGKLS